MSRPAVRSAGLLCYGERTGLPTLLSATADLSSILPFDAVQAHFSDVVECSEMRLAQLDRIMSECRSDMFLLATNCATRAKQLFVPNLDTAPLFPFLGSSDPKVIHAFGDLIGEPAIKDIYACRCTVNGQLVASLLISHVFPNDLYIGMITFADPSKPLHENQRKSVMQRHKGLGLLPTFMGRVERCAQSRKCDRITLVANETSQMTLFAKYGFAVDNYEVAQQKVSSGKLIPMNKTVSQAAT